MVKKEKMKYKVTNYHHRKAWIKGDLEAETIIESVNTFSSKKNVVSFLKEKARYNERKGFTVKLSTAIKGKMPELLIHTNTTWVHENTGEKHQEYYWYKVEAC